MGDDNSSKSWWNTLPGKITATTTLITALAGLIAAIQQTGFITAIQQSGFTSLLSKTTQSNPQCERTPREAVLSEGTGFSECKCCPEMVVLPNGSAISKYEISKGEYAAYLADKADKNPNNDSRCYAPRLLGATVSFEPDDSFNWRNPGFSQNDDEPVVCVSWYDAKAYADWLSTKTKAIYGIPTKEEILYATDANTSSKVFWKNSETTCEYANINDIKSHAINKFNWDYARCDDGYPQTNTKIPRQTAGQMEKSFKPNRLGVFHLIGNVYEWLSTNEGCGTAGQTWIWGGSWTTAPDRALAAPAWCQSREFKAVDIGVRVVRRTQ